jgi:hypothetical protein
VKYVGIVHLFILSFDSKERVEASRVEGYHSQMGGIALQKEHGFNRIVNHTFERL